MIQMLLQFAKVKCQICGTDFAPYRPHNKVCSANCRREYMRRYLQGYEKDAENKARRAIKRKAYYAANYEKLREAQKIRAAMPKGKMQQRIASRRYRATVQGLKMRLVCGARKRNRELGFKGGNLKVSDLVWPSHCPVLGIELNYNDKSNRECRPSLDRWDNKKGYTRGNVFVISSRANRIKSNATPEELWRIAQYANRCPTSKPKFALEVPLLEAAE